MLAGLLGLVDCNLGGTLRSTSRTPGLISMAVHRYLAPRDGAMHVRWI